MMVDGFGNKYYYMSFTIYQNNEKQIEIITRPKMGSSTLQHPGIVYDKKPGDRVVRLRNPNEGRHGLFGPKRGLKDGWGRYDGFDRENNNWPKAGFGPANLNDLTWLKYLKPNNTKYFLYRNPIQKYASGLTQIYYYGFSMIEAVLIVPEGMDPNNPQKHLVLSDKGELHRAKPGTKSVNPNYVSKLLHYYQTQPDSFFENYGDQVDELDPSYKNLQYVDPHVIRGLIHAVILKLLYPEKTQLVLLDNLDDVIRKHIISDDNFDVERLNVTNDSDVFMSVKSEFALDMHNIKTTMAKRFKDVITKESTDYSKFLSLEIKIWEELENNSEPLSILKMVVTELESNNLPILEKNYYEYLIECFRKQYGII